MATKAIKSVEFSKNQLIKSKKYKDKVDLLMALLADSKNYSAEEVDKLINDFTKKEVK